MFYVDFLLKAWLGRYGIHGSRFTMDVEKIIAHPRKDLEKIKFGK
jgi:hypothetical protein